MADTILIYDPSAPCASAADCAPTRLDALAGKTVGFIDNAKPNFHHLVDDLAHLLVTRHRVAHVVKRTKRGPSMPAARELIEELAARCDLVITGSGD